MRDPIRLLLGLAVIAALLVIAAGPGRDASRAAAGVPEVDGARYRVDPGQAQLTGAREIDEATLRAGFTPKDVDTAQQAQVAQAVAGARPEARRLIAIVDGLVDLHGQALGDGKLGVTQPRADGRYDVGIDFATVEARFGRRGMARTVLHELGHVVDDAIVPAQLDEALDAGIPRGYACEDEVRGSCAVREERFAESFAKWAMNDIGVDLDVGYKVAPPTLALSAWGAPLAALAGR
jgi:hypothetical protein